MPNADLLSSALTANDLRISLGIKPSAILELLARCGFEVSMNEPLPNEAVLAILSRVGEAAYNVSADSAVKAVNAQPMLRALAALQAAKDLCDRRPQKIDRQKVYGRHLEQHWDAICSALTVAIHTDDASGGESAAPPVSPPAAAVTEPSDSVRLDWVARHQPQVDYSITGATAVVWLGPLAAPDGVAGQYSTQGKDLRECIDKFLLGQARRVDA